jgi:hypothetical protein
MKKPTYFRVNMTFDRATSQKAKALAAEQTSTVSGLIRQLVRDAWAAKADKINRQLEDA